MNTKGTEFSIFQGAPSIHIDNDRQRIEEEEAIEDQKRRHAELNHELQTAFADLEDDEVNDTANSTRYSNGHTFHNKFQPHPPQHQPFPLRDSEAHMKNLLESKTREIDYVTSQLNAERKQHKTLVEEYEKRLAIAEAEKERALMTRDQTHELLVENKSKAIATEETHAQLQSRIRSLESENSKLVGELESTKLMLSDVQIKYNMVEKNVMFNADRNTDQILKQAKERHSAQMAIMQTKIEGLKTKYEDMEHDHKNLEIRYKELQRSRESMLIEKSEIINLLNKNLEDAQRQCQDLLARPNLSQENRQLQNLVRSAEFEKEELSRTINKLQKKIQDQTSEMEVMDSIVQECGGNNVSFSESSKFIHRDPLKNVNSSTPMAPEARLARIKEELCKSLNNIKNKREEIKICEQQLAEKDSEIKQLKDDENRALVQMNYYRDESIRLESKARFLELEMDKIRQEMLERSENMVTDEKYEEKMKKLQQKNESLEKELNKLKADYERLSMKNGELTEKEDKWTEMIKELEDELKNLQDTSKVIDDLKKERDRVQVLDEELKKYRSLDVTKVDQATQPDDINETQANSLSDKSSKNIDGACQNCEENLLKLEKFELSCLRVQNSNADYLTDLRKAKQELTRANQMVECLEEKLNLKELRDQEIEKLKKKAEEFEDYMRIHSTRSASTVSNMSSSGKSSLTNTSINKHDASTETSDLNDDDDAGRKMRQMETRARDEMAKIYAGEMKSMEKQFREEVDRIKKKMVEVAEESEEVAHELSVRREQIELLKFTIRKEREESEKILREKDEDFQKIVEKYRTEHESSQQKVHDLILQLNEKKEVMEEERISIETLKAQIKDERVSLAKREDETRIKLKKLQHESTQIIEELNEKYLSAKKTARNYKQYSEDKENHFRSECDRIKKGYTEAVENIHKRCKESMLEKDKKIKQMEVEFEYKIQVLKELLDKNN